MEELVYVLKTLKGYILRHGLYWPFQLLLTSDHWSREQQETQIKKKRITHIKEEEMTKVRHIFLIHFFIYLLSFSLFVYYLVF